MPTVVARGCILLYLNLVQPYRITGTEWGTPRNHPVGMRTTATPVKYSMRSPPIVGSAVGRAEGHPVPQDSGPAESRCVILRARRSSVPIKLRVRRLKCIFLTDGDKPTRAAKYMNYERDCVASW